MPESELRSGKQIGARCAKLVMSRRKKRLLPPRTLRMDRHGRLQSARQWLATQRGRTAERIARSYRKRYGVDWACAITELSALGLAFDPKWRDELARTLEGARHANARRREARAAVQARDEFPESNETFAFIAGYTEGGAPFGVTWEEWEKIERSERGAPIERPLKRDASKHCDDESLPF